VWPYGKRDHFPLCIYVYGEKCDWVQPFSRGDAVAIRYRPYTKDIRRTKAGNFIPLGSNTLERIRPLFPDEIKRYEREDAEVDFSARAEGNENQ
jgi:hypothetical protein